jgi:hypothetical protein
MQTLFEALPVILRMAGADPQVREGVAFAVWRRVAGDGVKRVSVPIALDDRTLIIAVIDQTWKNQLEKLAPEFLRRMDRLLAGLDLERLDFRVDPAAVSAAVPPEETPHTFTHTEEIMRELRPSAERIADQRLREIFLHAAARSIERKDETAAGER